MEQFNRDALLKPQMSASECVEAMRTVGFRISVMALMDGLEEGYYPFGRIKSRGVTGRRTPEIYRGDFERWLKEKLGVGA